MPRFSNPDDYFLTVRASSKAEVFGEVASKFAELVERKPAYACDEAQVMKLTADRLHLLPESDDHDVRVVVSGYSLVCPERNVVLFSSLAVTANLAQRSS